MSTIVTRGGKGSRLTHTELDNNFTSLNDDKIESTLAANIDADSTYKIVNMVDPTSAQDAATKAYVDSEISTSVSSSSSSVVLEVRNASGVTISKGQPVYIAGHSGSKILIAQADADDATKMPAIGLMSASTTNNTDGTVVSFGIFSGVNTSGYTVGDTLYVGTTPGTLSNSPPTGETALIQNIGKVGRVDSSVGEIVVSGPGRSNATPNLDDDQFFLGNGSNQAVATDFSDAVGSTTATLTNKSGNISQWTNDSGYLTSTLTGALDVDGNNIQNSSGTHVNINDGLSVEGSVRFSDSTGSYYVGLTASTTSHTSYDLVLPTATGTSGQALITDGSGNLSFSTISAGLGNIVEDTSPQLGGNLDVNTNKIVSTSNGNIDIEPNGTGNVFLGNLHFDADQTVGAGQDNYVLTYDDATGLISLEAATGAGALQNVVEDTTPQLGGTLDLNSQGINGTGNITNTGNTETTGNIRALGNNAYVEAAKIYGRDQDNFGLWIVPEGGASGTNSLRIHTDVNGFMQLYSPGTPLKLVTAGGTSPDDITIEAGGNINLDPGQDGGSGNIVLGGTFDVNNQTITDGSGTEIKFNDNLRLRGTSNIFFEEGTSGTGIKLQAPTGVTGTPTFTLPSADGTTGQVLQTNGSGVLSFVSAAGGLSNVVEDTTPQLGGDLDAQSTHKVINLVDPTSNQDAATKAYVDTNTIANVADDTTPQLGGNLDVNGNSLVSTSNGNITLTPNGTGDVVLGTMTFDADQTIGAGQDNYVLTYDNATGKISLEASAGGGGGGDVVDDTTPQLGGDLDINGFDIVSSVTNQPIKISPSGTGKIQLDSPVIQTNLTDTVGIGDKTIIGSPTFQQYAYANTAWVTGNINYVNAREMDVTAGGTNGGRLYLQNQMIDVGLTSGTNITGSNARMRLNHNQTTVDLNGGTYEGTSMGRGILAHTYNSALFNDSTTNATAGRYVNIENVMFPAVNRDFDTGAQVASGHGDLSIANMYCMNAGIDSGSRTGDGVVYVTSDSAVYRTDSAHRDQNAGITWNSGALAYNIKNDKTDLAEKLGSVKHYSELAYEATHSASGTFTVDYDNGNSQIITLSDNITSFTMSNFPGDNQWSGTPMIGALTLYLKQDGTGGRTVSFTAGASETFKIANGITTVDSGANNYTVVHVQHVDGTYLWTISGNYT